MSSQNTQNAGSRFVPNGSAFPFTAAMDMWREEMERLTAEQAKAVERTFQEAERMLGEAYRVASANLTAQQEATRRMQDLVKTSLESFKKVAQ